MANEVFTVYADDSCSPESFVMSAPLDILVTAFGFHPEGVKRIVRTTTNGEPCIMHANRGLFLGRFNQVVIVKAVR